MFLRRQETWALDVVCGSTNCRQENNLVAREYAIRDLDEAKLYVCHLLRSQG
jgi:hypothetical protein